ncbi:MAG: glutaminyl-peptide cyclotransferase [Desulfobulbaceae bacterium]
MNRTGRKVKRRFLHGGASFFLLLAFLIARQTWAAPVWGYRVVASYPHDPDAFTQGLVISEGVLYEGTGLNGRSSLRRVDLETGRILKLHPLPSIFFGEGVTVFGDRIIQLTWKAGIGLVYDRDSFLLLENFSYEGEGWGLTHDTTHLIMSDGSSVLRFLDPQTFQEVKRIRVKDGEREITSLNELEYVRGSIYANVWKEDRIAVIEPGSGRVTAWLDLSGILAGPRRGEGGEEVLNGIAYDAREDALYVTGKLWPTLFRIEPVVPAGP